MTKETISAKRAKHGFLARLRDDVAGNTLMITAGALLPLTALIGAGVDTSRAYLVKARLQQACDAGALAARKFMGGGSLTTDVQTKAQTFFSNNFPNATYGTDTISFTPTETTDGQVRATATARVPMTLMTVFGNSFATVNVSCDAKLEIGNSDIMFVLDITGSMACAPEDSSSACISYIASGGFNPSTGRYTEKTNSRMAGLRAAVMDFYDEIDSAVSDGSRVRYGIVPYSSNVNLGSTSIGGGTSTPGILRPEWIVDSWSYQSRDANMTTQVSTNSTPVNVTEVYNSGASISQTDCSNYGRNRFPTIGSNPVVTGTAPSPTTTTSYTNNANGGVDWGYTGAPDRSGTTRSCRRTRSTFTTTFTFTFTNWTYQLSSLDVSSFKTGGTLRLAQNNTGSVNTSGTYTLSALAAASTGGSNISLTWTGCIEERDTVATDDFDPIPGNAFDLDIDRIPDSEQTRWRPAIPQMVYNRSNQDTEVSSTDLTYLPMQQPSQLNANFSCNKRAWKMGERTRAQMNDYVYGSDFVPHGGTYHDIGMIWGARLISPTGLFASENATAPNGRPIDRHIIFMTDGDMSPNRENYTMYGFEKLDNRVDENPAGTVEELKVRHNARFVAACNAARARGITIWVIGFSQSLTPQLTACADPGNAFTSNNTATLRQQFRQIASRIAQLRLER